MRTSIPIIAAAMLSVCGLALADEDKAAEVAAEASKTSEAKGGDCLFARTINGWDSIDNETMIIWATRRDPYLVKLWTPVFGLKSEFSVGIQDGDNDGRFCDYGRDAIVVQEPGGPERYRVRTVQRLAEADAQAMIESRKQKGKKPEEPAVTMPEQSDVKSDKPK